MKTSRFQRKASLFLVFAVMYGAAQAQPQDLAVATGSCSKDSCSTYVTMFRELKSRCSGGIPLTEVLSNGSVESVDRLLNNEVNAGIVQTDVLFWRRRTEDLNNIKTLVALHPEEIHFVAKVNSGLKTSGNTFGFDKQDIVFTSVDNLAGYRVGVVANSGSMVTARLIRAEGNINYQVVLYDSYEKLQAALESAAVQAMVLVGGSPLPAVASLDPSYKLLGFSQNLQTALKDIYKPATLNYTKMNASGVKSLATEANLVTREYKTPQMVSSLAALRSCAMSAIPELKEARGTHKKWQSVHIENQGKWPWYELPVVSATTKKK